MSLVFQDAYVPGEMLAAIESAVDASVTRIRIAAAYVTTGGVRLLMPRIERRLGVPWTIAEKVLVTGFDFGFTDPDALVELEGYGFTVLIREPRVLHNVGLRPRSAYHPKAYAFDVPGFVRRLVGSANLTDRALTLNSEMGEFITAPTPDFAFEDAWSALIGHATAMNPVLLADYVAARNRIRRTPTAGTTPPDLADPPLVLAAFPVVPASHPSGTFEAAVDGGLNPWEYDNFWIEAGSMSSGGSHNQLELPRFGQEFFLGRGFANYDKSHREIGRPPLMALGQVWLDRPLKWHGKNNRMERLNLPTLAGGGFAYGNSAVLFRRVPAGFILDVSPWDDALALSWRDASSKTNLVFRLGATSNRVCGLF